MLFYLHHTTPKCTTDSCRAMRNVTHLTFDSYELAQAFIRAHNLSNVSIKQIHVGQHSDAPNIDSVVESRNQPTA